MYVLVCGTSRSPVGVGVLYWERSRERRRGCDGEADWDTAR